MTGELERSAADVGLKWSVDLSTVVESPGSAVFDTETVYRAHAGEVSRWVRALAGPEADVEDLVQEVFVRVHHKLRSFRGDSALTTWLFGITHNVVRQHRRARKWRHLLGGTAAEVGGDAASPGDLPPEALARQEARLRVYQVLDRLSEKSRTALILFELEERPASDIAALYGVTPSVVWVWLSRARAQFLTQLAALERAEEKP